MDVFEINEAFASRVRCKFFFLGTESSDDLVGRLLRGEGLA